MNQANLLKGDNMILFKQLQNNSVDSVITDGPYGLKFMSKKWDYSVPSIEFWKEVYRVLKPGGHILSFGGTRTYHRMVVNIEDAGFEIRDQIQWLYGSGFPKSLNIGKNGGTEGWGTGLKPANEPICLARKPISENTITENVLKWGTGGINVDGCRIKSENNEHFRSISEKRYKQSYLNSESLIPTNSELGRFPSNLILDEEAAELLDSQSGVSKSSIFPGKGGRGYGAEKNTYKNHKPGGSLTFQDGGYSDSGGASRFFYIAKVSKSERNMGLDGFEDKDKIGNLSDVVSDSINKVKNNHPTIKPINLMSYLCRLITPKGGIILDPFMGSGSTGIASRLEGFDFIGMEMDEEYFKIAEQRINSFELYRKFIKK